MRYGDFVLSVSLVNIDAVALAAHCGLRVVVLVLPALLLNVMIKKIAISKFPNHVYIYH